MPKKSKKRVFERSWSPFVPIDYDSIKWALGPDPRLLDAEWFNGGVDWMFTFCAQYSFHVASVHIGAHILWTASHHAHVPKDLMLAACMCIGVKVGCPRACGAEVYDAITEELWERKKLHRCESAILVLLDYKVPALCLLDFVDETDTDLVNECNALVKNQERYNFNRLEDLAAEVSASVAMTGLQAAGN